LAKKRRRRALPKPARIFVLITALFWGLTGPGALSSASAQNRISLLRDAETEWFLRWIGTPLFEAAGLQPNAVNIYLINDPTMNAFVSGGQNIFFHAGLIMELDDVNQMLGVYAHETGHISGAHLARSSDGAAAPTAIALGSMILGVAAILAGASDAGLGLMMGGQTMAQRSFLVYTRSQENQADQAGAGFLEATGTSGRGMLETFERFRDQELLSTRRRDPYATTHPLSGQRVQRLTDRVQRSPYFDTPPREDYQYWYARIRAKLKGYLQEPWRTFSDYPESDQSDIARYARIYAYQKDLKFDRALEEANGLIRDYPEDPFFQEIAGQVLLESSRVEQSLDYYRKANALSVRNPILMTQLAHALVALETPEYDKEAAKILEQIVVMDRVNDFAWRQLSVIYARTGQEEKADLATAEMFQLQGQVMRANYYATRAVDKLPEGSPGWLRAQDILIQTQFALEEYKRQNRRRRPFDQTYLDAARH